MILDSTSLKLEAVLGGAVAANQPEVTVVFINYNVDGVPSKPATVRSALSSSTDVTILAAPSVDGHVREPQFISIYNKDTASVTVTVKTDDGTTERILHRATLATLEALQYEKGRGWYALTSSGAVKNGQGKSPTRQVFTSGSGTYTTPSGCAAIDVELVGGGGGGGGTGSSGGGAGGNGGNTTFSTITGNGGTGGNGTGAAVGGAGGTATGGDVNISGGDGAGTNGPGAPVMVSGHGGGSFFGGFGPSTASGNNSGNAAEANTGSGGGGAATDGTRYGGCGGGAGGYARKLIANPAATYSYAVGAAGSAGAAGTGGQPGGAGAAGIIIVTEFYT